LRLLSNILESKLETYPEIRIRIAEKLGRDATAGYRAGHGGPHAYELPCNADPVT
jgi:hypothetical protein